MERDWVWELESVGECTKDSDTRHKRFKNILTLVRHTGEKVD